MLRRGASLVCISLQFISIFVTQAPPIMKTFRLILSSIALLFLSANVNATTITNSCTIAGDTSVCEQEVVSYTSGYSGAYSYQWTAFGGAISGSNTNPSVTVNWSYTGSGQLAVIIKDSLNNVVCSKLINVTIHPLPQPEITADFESDCRGDKGAGGNPDDEETSCVQVCDSTWVKYSTPLNAGSTYTWIVDGTVVYSSSANTADVFWTTLGIGTVTVIETNAFGCSAEHEICVEVIPRPVAKFKTIPTDVFGTITVCLNQDVLFFNQSHDNGGSPITSYEWIYGDGDNDLFTPPDSGHTTHAYASSGTYTVHLIVVNECGCRDTASIEVVVLDEPGPDITCISTVCPGTVMTYTTSASCPGYSWSVSNGTILGSSTNQTVSVQWGSNGPAILTLDVDTCSSYCPTPTSIIVPLIPSNASIAGDTLVCEYTCNTYSLDCSIPVDSIIWHVPPGLSIIGDTINVHELTICVGAASFSGTIWVEYFHNTNGSTNELNCGGNAYLPLHVRPNLSILGPAKYCENESFAFYVPGPSGNISWTLTNATGTTTYLSSILPATSPLTGTWFWGPGTFVLMANDLSNKYCNPKVTKIITVNTSPPQPVIIGPDSVCPNSTHNYSATLSNSNHAVSWNVVGGTPASGNSSSINITWNSTGPYIVYATEVDRSTGCKSIADTMIVQSLLPLTAAIINGPDSVCGNGMANYSSPSPADTYYWTINSPSSASVSAGQHSNAIQIQANNTTGTAWLVLTRTLCSQTRKDSVLIYIIPPPSPSITAPAVVCQNANFSVSTSTSASSYSWNFGDGNTASGASATHSYDSSGSFVITLTVNYGGSCPVSATATKNISVNPAPVVNISTGDPTLYCTPISSISTSMTMSTSVGTTSCTWYKAPSTALSSSSSYTATSIGSYYAVCTNTYGCSDTSNFIVIDTMSCDTCNPEPYNLRFDKFRLGCNTDSFVYISSNVSSHSWNFGDIYNPGSNSASGNNVTHTYTEPGIYVIKLCGLVPNIVSTDPDCEVCVTQSDTINYVPDFYPIINCTDYSSSFTVTFKNTTKVYALAPSPNYSWKINGGSVLSTATDYTTSLGSGTYNVELIIDGVCSLIKTITIDSLANASFIAADSICEDAPISFINTSTGIYNSPVWDYGDATSSLNPAPIKVYENGGTYSASLTITNEYGCKDSAVLNILVLPNNLSAFISLSGPNEFCFGDSVDLSVNASGGYPAYTYLWSNTSTAPTITTYYTGNYGVQVWDSRSCYTSVPDTVVKVNPLPNATIIGPKEACLYDQIEFKVPLPNAGHTINWYVNGVNYGSGNALNFFASAVGTDVIVVTATNSYGCSSSDTSILITHDNPNVTVSSFGSLCEGDSTLLVAKSTSTNLVSMKWNTGSTNDSIYVTNAGFYTNVVIDSNGCKAQASVVIHELPDFCGLLTGCYEICDTVTSLVWHAPKGYAAYQWYFNGVPISGSIYDTLHIPLYQSGTYTVEITTINGCSDMSDPIEISFIHCGSCVIETSVDIDCGPVDHHGNQTYTTTFTINNPLGAGASLSISSSQGAVTGLSPSVLATGLNTVTATFTDNPPTDTSVCFHIAIWDQDQRCDTIICDTLPDCGCSQEEKEIVSQEPFECIGYDGSGNPQYYGCINVLWGGSGSSTLTLVESSSGFSPNVFNLTTGSQSLCFTYTDLPPLNPGFVMIHAYFYDSLTHKTCLDSFRIHYKDCPRECVLDVTSLCAHCRDKNSAGEWIYQLEMDVYNPFGGFATASIVPTTAGTFGTISPNPIPPGTTTISTLFTDTSPADSIVCFRLILMENHGSAQCYKDICISLPDCEHLGMGTVLSQEGMLMSIYPNPASNFIYIDIDESLLNESYEIVILDILGQEVHTQGISHSKEKVELNDLPSGIYIANIKLNDELIIAQRFVIEN